MRLASAALVMLLAGGCSSPDVPNVNDAGSPACAFNCQEAGVVLPVATRIKGLLQVNCSNGDGCHAASAGNLPMPFGSELGSLVGVPSSQMPSVLRVKPGDPAESYLYRKVACDAGPILLSCMPPGAHLDPAIVGALHDWIEAGAPTQ